MPGGALIRDASGGVIGAVGVSGDTSDNDELAGVAGVKAAGLTADVGTGLGGANFVMAGWHPRLHDVQSRKTWMPGTRFTLGPTRPAG